MTMPHPDFDTPENHLSRHPLPAEPEPDRTCPGCEGDGKCHYDDALPGEACEWCGGSGVYVRPEPTEAERKERYRFETRLLTEPGFEMAVRFLLDQRAARHRAEIEREALKKAA